MKRLKKDRPRGVILYRGPSLINREPIVVVATFESRNEKTGDMVQVWILPDGEHDPRQAIRADQNQSVCGDCACQGKWDADRGQMVGRLCYVAVGRAPLAIWRGVRRGIYPTYQAQQHRRWFVGRQCRNGAYGDPAAMPVRITRWLAGVSSGITGYSHQMFAIDRRRADALAEFVMVSAHAEWQVRESIRRGWRYFAMITTTGSPPADAMECPHYTHGIECEQCLLCCGTSKGARSIFVRAHGKGAVHLHQIQLQEAAR
jgi:hypothetical protein